MQPIQNGKDNLENTLKLPTPPEDLGFSSRTGGEIVFKVENGKPMWTDSRYNTASLDLTGLRGMIGDHHAGGNISIELFEVAEGTNSDIPNHFGEIASQHIIETANFILKLSNELELDWEAISAQYFAD